MPDVTLASLIKPSLTFTGDATGTGAESIELTLAAAAVELANMANLAANTLIGNNTGSAATPIALTVTQLKTMLGISTLEAALTALTDRVVLLEAGGPPPAMTGMFVNYVTGNDSNDGLSESSPKKTLVAAVAAVAVDSTIWIANGSVFHQSIKPTKNGSIKVYSTGAVPVIDGADVVTGWTRHDPGGLPNVWSISHTREMPIKGEDRLGLWANGIRPRFANTLADLNSNGGWFTFNQLTSETETIYIHSTVDPNSSGVLYEVTKRKNGIHWHGTAHTVNVEGPLEIKRALDHYNGISGGMGTIKKVLIRDGSLHHFVVESSLVEDVLGTEFNPKTVGPAPFTFFRDDGLTYAPVAKRVGFVHPGGGSRLADISSKAFYGHSSGSTYDSSLNGHTLEQCWSVGFNFGGIVSRANGLLRGCYALDNQKFAFELYGPDTLQGTLCHDTGGGNYTETQIRKSTGAAISVTNHCGHSTAGSCVENAAGVSTYTNCSFSNGAGNIFGSDGGTPTLTKCILSPGGRVLQGLDNFAGDYNVFFAPNGQDHPWAQFKGNQFLTSWNFLLTQQQRNGSNTNSVWCKSADQNSGNPLAFWLGVKNGTGGPEVGDYRINPGARVYTGSESGTERIGTFLDGTPLTEAGAQQHWDWNARAWAAGPVYRLPSLPLTLAQMRTYITNPTAWNFYP